MFYLLKRDGPTNCLDYLLDKTPHPEEDSQLKQQLIIVETLPKLQNSMERVNYPGGLENVTKSRAAQMVLYFHQTCKNLT